MKTLWSLLLLIACAPAAMAQQSQAPHEHGVAELRVAVADRALRIEFTAPLDNLVGFEHAPRTEKHWQALREAEEALRRFESLFRTPPAAACTVKAVDLHSPWPQGRDTHNHHKHHDHGHHGEEGHAEMQVTYDLECTHPQALTELQVQIMEVFPRTHRIRAETATPRGQNALTLDKSKRSIPL